MGFAFKTEYLPHYTYEDYCQWGGNWELIEGVLYAMSPSPTYRHQKVATNILTTLSNQLKSCKNCEALSPFDWKINENTVVQPYVSVICKPVTNNNYLTFAPILIFEVISPASVKRDKNIKFELYKSEGVKFYVVVDVQTEKAEIFELKGVDYVKVLQAHDQLHTFQLDGDCSVQVSFAAIW